MADWKKIHHTVVAFMLLCGCNSYDGKPDQYSGRPPVIFPDYTDVVFPANIAPPNFRIEEDAEACVIEIGFDGETVYRKKLRKKEAVIPVYVWNKLLSEAKGKSYYTRISTRKNGEWLQYEDIMNRISEKPVDPYLVYRLLYPGYEFWNEMGIYQRDLTSYKEMPVIENREVEKGCVNCHTFNRNSPESMIYNIRGKAGGTVIRKNGKTHKVQIKDLNDNNSGAYSAWHPGGRYIAMSSNNVQQYFHSTGTKAIEVSDLDSDLIFFDTETNETFSDSTLYGPDWMETFPAWNPQGNWLYYCRAPKEFHIPPDGELRYGLYRVSFDPGNRSFGQPECVYASFADGKSISHPRISPDGRYLMFCRFDYGTFSIWHPESELCLLNMETNEIRKMEEVNSEDVESYHGWSSSGEWFVFSSKRIDGLWAHPYIAYFDSSTGKATKPFIVPQKDPEFYAEFTKTFNLPEFIVSPIE
jgi:hypothetical protein